MEDKDITFNGRIDTKARIIDLESRKITAKSLSVIHTRSSRFGEVVLRRASLVSCRVGYVCTSV